MVTTTVFAPDDYRVLSVDFRLRHPDGSENKIASGVMLYDQEVRYTDAVQSYLDAQKCTVTVQMADGSKRMAFIPKGEEFSWDCDDGFALYGDAEGKMPLSEESVPVEEDMMVYVLDAQK
ncbi:hypothetical protein SDC9_129376 [bioreactor metagenome]|uniref:Uncharacterized protein n=1 Tax=bioreactor metagenome TaxID=1076179 RepID=A0A645CZL4_9ZZZZ